MTYHIRLDSAVLRFRTECPITTGHICLGQPLTSLVLETIFLGHQLHLQIFWGKVFYIMKRRMKTFPHLLKRESRLRGNFSFTWTSSHTPSFQEQALFSSSWKSFRSSVLDKHLRTLFL